MQTEELGLPPRGTCGLVQGSHEGLCQPLRYGLDAQSATQWPAQPQTKQSPNFPAWHISHFDLGGAWVGWTV